MGELESKITAAKAAVVDAMVAAVDAEDRLALRCLRKAVIALDDAELAAVSQRLARTARAAQDSEGRRPPTPNSSPQTGEWRA
jgi:hypothetical protein